MAILTVSRQFGSGSKEVILGVMASLGYELVDKKLLLNDIKESGVKWETWAKELDQSAPSFWEKYDRSFRGFGAFLQSLLLTYAAKDNVILKGRGSNFLMERVPHAFRVRLVAPIQKRVDYVSVRDSLDRATAQFVVERADSERAGFIYALCGKDVNDPGFYDATFDTAERSVEEIVEAITQALLERDKLKTPEASRALEVRAAAAKIKAKLMMDPRLYVPVMDVDCAAGEITVRGVVRNSDQYKRISAAAKEMAGSWPLKMELKYRV